MHICIGDFLLDIVQNSFEANSTKVGLTIRQTEQWFDCLVQDNGKGMDAEVQKRVLDPFYTDGEKHAKRKVGLGLPFLVQACEACEGRFSLHSEVGSGTEVAFSFNLQHVDAPPIGDLVSTFVLLLSHPSAKQLVIKRSLETARGTGDYTLDKEELEDILGGLETAGELNLLRQYIASGEQELMQYYQEAFLHTDEHMKFSKQQER